MANELVETVNGKRSKFEIYRSSKTFGGFEFTIYKDGTYWKSGYSSLSRAVDVAKNEG